MGALNRGDGGRFSREGPEVRLFPVVCISIRKEKVQGFITSQIGVAVQAIRGQASLQKLFPALPTYLTDISTSLDAA